MFWGKHDGFNTYNREKSLFLKERILQSYPVEHNEILSQYLYSTTEISIHGLEIYTV